MRIGRYLVRRVIQLLPVLLVAVDATVLSFAKAKVTGQRIEGGENEKVEL